MVADDLRAAIQLIKSGKKNEAREILEPFIVANPKNIQAWVWEIETREDDAEKIKLMEACLLHNPDSAVIQKALAALKSRRETLMAHEEDLPSQPFKTTLSETKTEKFSGPKAQAAFLPEAEENSSEQNESILPYPADQAPFLIDAESQAAELLCPYCGEAIEQGAQRCESCGRELTPSEEEPQSPVAGKESKKWFRQTWVKIITFIFFLPLWCLIELTDPEARKVMKIFSEILLVFCINLLGLSLYWFFTTNSSSANLLTWYQYLTGRSSAIVPGGSSASMGACKIRAMFRLVWLSCRPGSMMTMEIYWATAADILIPVRYCPALRCNLKWTLTHSPLLSMGESRICSFCSMMIILTLPAAGPK